MTTSAYVNVPRDIFVELVKKVEDLDALVETLEILADPDFMKSIKQGEKELNEGKIKELKDVSELD